MKFKNKKKNLIFKNNIIFAYYPLQKFTMKKIVHFLFIFIFLDWLLCKINAAKRNLHESQIHRMKVYGDTNMGYYYINIFVGYPPQRQSVIIDTGSWITAFPCLSKYF